jgi:hypothetical protein
VIRGLLQIVPALIAGAGNIVAVFARVAPAAEGAAAGIFGFAGSLSRSISALSTWQAVLIGAALAGLGFLIYKLATARDATQQFTDGIQRSVEAADSLHAIGAVATGLAQVFPRLATAQNQSAAAARAMSHAYSAASAVALSLGANQAAEAVRELTAAQQQLVNQFKNVNDGVAYLGRTYGTTFAQGLALAAVAGVKLQDGITGQGKAALIAQAQIAGLVAGYKAMGQAGGVLSNDMNALAIRTGLQQTKVAQLNQAWDQFMTNATSLTGSFSSLITDVGQINNAITTTGQRFVVFGGKVVSSTDAAARSMLSFQGVGAQVWQNYNQALIQAEQYTSSLRTAAAYGGISQKALAQQVAYAAAQLLPYARYSQTAAEELAGLAEQAGFHATPTFKNLKDWIDRNSESAAQFNKQMMAETGQMSDVTRAAQEFASTLDSQVAAALDSAKISTANLTGAAQRLNQAYQQTHGTVAGPVIGAFGGLVSSLFKVYGSTETAEGIANAYARSLGWNQQQVRTLDHDIAGLVAQLNGIPNIHRTVTITQEYVTTGGRSTTSLLNPGYQAGAAYASAGAAVVGEHGPEIIYFRGGETVMPSSQAMPLLHGGGGGDGTINLVIRNDGSVAGSHLQHKIVTQSLTYNRRNPGNNLSLRIR